MDERFSFKSLGQGLLFAVSVVLWMALTTGPSHAAVYACPLANGETVYQDRPCAKLASQSSKASSSGQTSQPKNEGEYPFGMHRSWFVQPLYAPQPAYCDRLGCDCATQTRNFRHGLSKAVVDALFLETAWHRYAEQVIQLENDPPKGLAFLELQVGIEESACDIQMSQLTVKNYVQTAVEELKAAAEAAISRGNIHTEQCDGTDAKVCADVDAVDLYDRVIQDIKTLTVPRYFLIADAE